jgi:hypothetical protein
MTETKGSSTKALFDSLTKLYKQGQLLLMDADCLMGERGWEPRGTTAPAEFSYSLSLPERWYARWAARFYMRTVPEGEDSTIDRLLFVSIHFASDINTTLKTNVDDPIVCAGRLLYEKPMTVKAAGQTYDYWMCKYWFIGKPHDTLKGWRKTGQSRWYENLKGSESFIVPLYDITSREKLKELVIDPLLAVQEQEEQIT